MPIRIGLVMSVITGQRGQLIMVGARHARFGLLWEINRRDAVQCAVPGVDVVKSMQCRYVDGF